MIDSEQALERIFLSYDKILIRMEKEGTKTKGGKTITHKDLRAAVSIMIRKHSSCRWRSKKIKNRKYLILNEGYHWLVDVYFQKEKKSIDADIEFFLKRIKLYEDFLKIDKEKNFWKLDMNLEELTKYFNRDIATIKRCVNKMLKFNNKDFIFFKNNTWYVIDKGIEWICKNVFKQKYLALLEEYKMELTEQYIEKGYPYDHFLGRN